MAVMRIGDVKLSDPTIKFDVIVSHSTARNSTAIEWLILSAIDRCTSLSDEYGGVPVQTLFESIFKISDVDLLILPCLLSLRDFGAIEVSGLNDRSKLANVQMRSLRLTKNGTELHRDGRLPGAEDKARIEVFYNPVSQRLISAPAKVVQISQPDGIPSMDPEVVANVSFPESQIRTMLEQEQGRKHYGEGRFVWLNPTTHINETRPAATTVSWRAYSKSIQVNSGMVCKIDGIDDPVLNARALQSLSFDEPVSFDSLPFVQIYDPDKELKELFSYRDVDRRVKDKMGAVSLAIVNSTFWSTLSGQTFTGKGSISKGNQSTVLVVENCSSFDVTLKGRELIISIPGRILPEGTAFLSKDSSICLGKFRFKAFGSESGNIGRDAAMGYVPVTSPGNVEELITRVVDSYVDTDYRVAFALLALKKQTLFDNCIEKACRNKGAVKDRADFLELVNRLSLEFAGQMTVISNTAARLLFNPNDIKSACANLERAVTALSEYVAIPVFRQNDDLIRSVLTPILGQTPPSESLKELYKLWAKIKAIKPSLLTWLSQENLYRRFYFDANSGAATGALKDLMSSFAAATDDFYILTQEQYTPIEQVLVALKNAADDVLTIMPELRESYAQNPESVRECVLTHKNKIRQLKGDVISWRDNLERFETKLCSIDDLVRISSNLNIAASESKTGFLKGLFRGAGNDSTVKSVNFEDLVTLMKQVTDAVGIFYDDTSIKYNKVVIVDTCALMNRPDLFAWFADGKTMVIVPQIVLSELDGLKDSEDTTAAEQARAAIRNVGNYRAMEWVNTREVSDTSLLNKDLNPNTGDSKILSIALRYIIKAPIILSNDKNFQNIADAQGIKAMSTDAFEGELNDDTFISGQSLKDLAKGKGKKGKKGH